MNIHFDIASLYELHMDSKMTFIVVEIQMQKWVRYSDMLSEFLFPLLDDLGKLWLQNSGVTYIKRKVLKALVTSTIHHRLTYSKKYSCNRATQIRFCILYFIYTSSSFNTTVSLSSYSYFLCLPLAYVNLIDH